MKCWICIFVLFVANVTECRVPCPGLLCQWMSWKSWGSCSESCGGRGSRRRSRDLCCDTTLEFDDCVLKCGVRSSDSNEYDHTCADTCCHGNRYSSGSCRNCYHGYKGPFCNEDITPNNCYKCSWNGWGGWSSCSTTCGGGTKSRSRTPCCRVGQSESSCMSECYLYSSDKQDRTVCSQTCVNGGHFRYGKCECQAGFDGRCCEHEQTPNNCPKCSLGEWEAWSTCSSTCGGGSQTRTRKPCCRLYEDVTDCLRECRLPEENLHQTQNCSQTCDGGVFWRGECYCYHGSRGRCCDQRLVMAFPGYSGTILIAMDLGLDLRFK